MSQFITEVLILLLLIITFGFSCVEKLVDWKGTMLFYKAHFKNSPFKNMVPALVTLVIILEIITTLTLGFGCYQLIINKHTDVALYGVIFSAVTLLILLIGQRFAKDYAGSMSIVVYYIPTLFGIYLLSK